MIEIMFFGKEKTNMHPDDENQIVEEEYTRCCSDVLRTKISDRFKLFFHEDGDKAFMGMTHSLSAVAIFMVLLAFFPHVLLWMTNTNEWSVLVLFFLVLAGGALLPDLDSPQSRAESSLGVLGKILNSIFRGLAKGVQTVIRSKRDEADPDPHRGLWHTPLMSIITGALVFAATRIDTAFEAAVFGKINVGFIFAFFITLVMTIMALEGLFTKDMKKLKKKHSNLGELYAIVLALAIVTFLFLQLPEGLNFWWLGVATAVGMLVHIFGDLMTTAGCPIFFPVKIKGKMWWKVRIFPIKAGGATEKWFFTPMFITIIVVSSIFVFHGFLS